MKTSSAVRTLMVTVVVLSFSLSCGVAKKIHDILNAIRDAASNAGSVMGDIGEGAGELKSKATKGASGVNVKNESGVSVPASVTGGAALSGVGGKTGTGKLDTNGDGKEEDVSVLVAEDGTAYYWWEVGDGVCALYWVVGDTEYLAYGECDEPESGVIVCVSTGGGAPVCSGCSADGDCSSCGADVEQCGIPDGGEDPGEDALIGEDAEPWDDGGFVGDMGSGDAGSWADGAAWDMGGWADGGYDGFAAD
ncbi:MAG: hypothetical protein FJ313_07555 [Gemmatimonadetes bacterium]|nr:hypothetical protein [Gemmatimonadota bacterium]